MNGKKWYRCNIASGTTAAKLNKYLKQNNIYFEPSQNGNYIHFEIKATAEQADKINNYIDTITACGLYD